MCFRTEKVYRIYVFLIYNTRPPEIEAVPLLILTIFTHSVAKYIKYKMTILKTVLSVEISLLKVDTHSLICIKTYIHKI